MKANSSSSSIDYIDTGRIHKRRSNGVFSHVMINSQGEELLKPFTKDEMRQVSFNRSMADMIRVASGQKPLGWELTWYQRLWQKHRSY